MSYRGVGSDGMVWLFGDEALRQQVNVAVQRLIKDRNARKKMRDHILSHKTLVFDERVIAEERYKHQRANQCRSRIEKLGAVLEAGSIAFLDTEDSTDTTKLTAKKLVGHSVKVLDVDDDRMLLSVERHPFGGNGPGIIQYWLYSEGEKTLRFLNEQEGIEFVKAEMLVMKNGKWEAVDFSPATSFFENVETLLGAATRTRIEQSFHPRESQLISHGVIPAEVNEKVNAYTGIDLRLREEEDAHKREEIYSAKWGAPKTLSPNGWILRPEIGIGYSRQRLK